MWGHLYWIYLLYLKGQRFVRLYQFYQIITNFFPNEYEKNDKIFITFLDSTNLKLFGQKIQHFSNDAFQSYCDLFQVN